LNIILYTTHCPRCTVLKKKLEQKNIEFIEVDDVDKMLAIGMMAAPMLSVNGNLYDFPQAINWINSK